jgi:hypothetical protein
MEAKGTAMRVRVAMILTVLVSAAIGISASADPVAAGPVHRPVVGLRHSTSSNWAGYAAYGASGKFSSVNATWVQPSVTCGSQDTYSAYWVGLDGYNSSTVEQLGTEADCSGGTPTFYAWFEMYPHPGYYINTVTVKPGDSYTASVTYQGGGRFLLTLRDTTKGTSFGISQKLGSAQRASAEAIVEAPWSGGVLPLADFGTANFSGADANTAPIGTFSPKLDPMSMDDPYGMVAKPSSLTNGNDFSVTWSHP